MFDRNGVVVLGVLYRDAEHNQPLPGVIGPFANNEAAAEYMESLGRIWGSWMTSPCYAPASPESQTGDYR